MNELKTGDQPAPSEWVGAALVIAVTVFIAVILYLNCCDNAKNTVSLDQCREFGEVFEVEVKEWNGKCVAKYDGKWRIPSYE